jgi:WhiB family redox-sensing transcriptional regulator
MTTEPQRVRKLPPSCHSIRPGDWVERAACRGHDPDLFTTDKYEFRTSTADPEYTALVAEARRVCRRCPVQPECLQHAITNDEHGIWGGTTRAERGQIPVRVN